MNAGRSRPDPPALPIEPVILQRRFIGRGGRMLVFLEDRAAAGTECASGRTVTNLSKHQPRAGRV